MQLVRIDLVGVPLAAVQIPCVIHTDIMNIPEDRLVLQKKSELISIIFRLLTAGC